MQYILEGVHDTALARFGTLELNDNHHALPTASPGLRTKVDARAVLENVQEGMALTCLTPYVSRQSRLVPELEPLLTSAEAPDTVSLPRPLVIPDIESEALNFSCTAREEYKKLGAPGTVVGKLLATGLSNKGQNTTEVHSTWRKVQAAYGLEPVVSWMASHLSTIGSDVLFLPTPIVRDDVRTVRDAMQAGTSMLSGARLNYPEFPLHGIQTLLHGSLFRPTDAASEARAEFVELTRGWRKHPRTQRALLAIKIHDAGGELTHHQHGSFARGALSELISNLQEAIREVGGLLVVHNVGPWVLGALDSGADIASFRVTGAPMIEVPIANAKPRKGKKPTPPLMLSRSMATVDPATVKDSYEKTGTYPLPSFMHEAQPYWKFEKHTEKSLWAARVACGNHVDIGNYYRDAGLDTHIPLRDAVLSQIRESTLMQELKDLCPSAA